MLLAVSLVLEMSDDAAMTAYRARTRAEIPCRVTEVEDEITVCGRRDADRYRITFTTPDVRDSVPTERSQLLENKMKGCGRIGMVFTDCGFAGVAMTSGGGRTTFRTRKLAP